MSVNHTDAVIANGASESGVVNVTDMVLVSIHMPADWTTAAMTLLACAEEGGTFYPVHDPDGEVEFAVDDDMVFTVPPDITRGLRYIKLRSGNTAGAVNQGAARTIRLGLLPDDRA